MLTYHLAIGFKASYLVDRENATPYVGMLVSD